MNGKNYLLLILNLINVFKKNSLIVAITDPNITFKKSFVQELYNYIEHLEKDLGSRNPKFSDELEKVLKDSVLNPLQLAKKLEGHDKILIV